MAPKGNYIVYSQVLDCFIKVRKVDGEFVSEIFEQLDSLITKPGFKMVDFAKFITQAFVVNFTALSRKYGDAGVFIEASYEAVTEVYPSLTADIACKHFNLAGEDEDGETSIHSYNLKKLQQICRGIKKKVIGQEEAVNSVVDALKLMNTGFETFTSLFFIGPTGVGKTEVARQVASQ